MRVQDFPALKRALTEIAYDNGMVHRDQEEWLAVYDMFARIEKKYSVHQIVEVTRELGALTDEQLIEACTGGCDADRPRSIATNGLADEMLDWAFDGDISTLAAKSPAEPQLTS